MGVFGGGVGRASELGDQRKLVGEHRATSEKDTEGWAELERSRRLLPLTPVFSNSLSHSLSTL